jgi:signal transduction histidine kinase
MTSGAFTPEAPSSSGAPREALQPHGEGQPWGVWARRSVFAFFALHIVFLLLWTGPGRAPTSCLLLLCISLGSTAVCFYNARLAPVRSRFWKLTGASFLLWSVSLAVSIVYEDVLHISINSWWLGNLLALVAPAPLLLAVDDSAETRRIRFVDVLHVVTVSVAVYLCFIFIPWRNLGDSAEFGLRVWKVSLIRDAVMTLLLLGRLLRDREWPSSGAVAAYLFAFGAGESVYLYYHAQGRLHSGALADMVWSVPFVLAVLISRREHGWKTLPRRGRKGAVLYGAVILHAVLISALLFSIATFTGTQLRVAQAGLALSFLMFAIRIVRIHRVLAETIEQMQSLNQGLETRVQERTRQLQMANRKLQLQNTKISRLVAFKRRFMANVSHEFRTPLNAVIGFSSLLLQGSGHDAGKRRQYLEHVRRSAIDLSWLVNDVLDYVDLDTGDARLSLVPVELRNLCRTVVTGMEPVLDEKQLQIDCQIAEVRVMADEARLRQVVLNLLKTAIQFTPPHGTIRLFVDERPGQAEIRICDGGHGIPLERMEEVFGEFSQLGPDREMQMAGPGLRLALARKLVEMHGGSIHVESGFGQGASFIFSLPATSC